MNLTQVQFASRLRISKGFLSNLEKGIRQPSDQLIRLIAFEYSCSENWIVAGEGEMFLSPEEVIKTQIDRLGEQAFYDALKKIMNSAETYWVGKSRDPVLEHMHNFLNDLWAAGDEDLKAWAKVQFARAFPPDVEEEVQKKRTGKTDRESTA